MNNTQEKIWDALSELTAEQVLNLITDWYGLGMFDDDFLEFLQDEGIIY